MVKPLWRRTIEGNKVREIIKEFEDQNSLPTRLQELKKLKLKLKVEEWKIYCKRWIFALLF